MPIAGAIRDLASVGHLEFSVYHGIAPPSCNKPVDNIIVVNKSVVNKSVLPTQGRLAPYGANVAESGRQDGAWLEHGIIFEPTIFLTR